MPKRDTAVKKFRWAVVGVGQIAYQVTAALKSISRIELYAVHSRSSNKAARVAKDFGFAKAFTDYDQLLADPSVDILYLATPNHTHLELTLRAIKAGKHVLCEKPIGMTAGEVLQISSAQKKGSSVVMEGLWSRFLPVYHKVEDLLRQGVAGLPLAYETSLGHLIPFVKGSRFYDKAQGGGVLLDLGVYPLSLALMLFGDIVDTQLSLTHAASGVEDEALLTVTHANKVSGDIKVSFKRQLRNDWMIYGTRGRIEIEAPIYRPCRYRILPYSPALDSFVPGEPLSYMKKISINPSLFARKEGLLRIMKGIRGGGWKKVVYRGNGYGHQAEALMDAVEDNRFEVPGMTLEDSAKVLAIIDRCRKQEA
jgi:predicted dehydrogenase